MFSSTAFQLTVKATLGRFTATPFHSATQEASPLEAALSTATADRLDALATTSLAVALLRQEALMFSQEDEHVLFWHRLSRQARQKRHLRH